MKKRKYKPEELNRGKPYDYRITLTRDSMTGLISYSYAGYRTIGGVREKLAFLDGSMDIFTPQPVRDSKEEARELLIKSPHLKSISIRSRRR